MPIRLAICSSGELFGGVEEHISTLSRRTTSPPQITTLVILFNRGMLVDRLLASGVRTHVLRKRHKYDPLALPEVVRLFLRHRINVVHVHGYRATTICGLAGRMAGARIVKTEHGVIEPMGRPWARARMRANLALDGLVTRWCADRIVYVSEDLAARLSFRDGRPERCVIPNGIELPPSEQRPVPPRLDLGAFNVGIVGRLAEVKGHSVLFRAVASLRNCPGLVTHVFGEGRLEGALRKECVDLGLERQVRFHGFRKDIINCMAAMDAIAMPSYHEGVPYTVLQAMSLGLPVVASCVGGLREILEDGKDAILTEPGNAESVAQALGLLYREPAVRKELGHRASGKAQTRFSARAMVERYVDLYRELLRDG